MNHLAEAEYRFACLVWDNEPIPSGQLVKLCEQVFQWKKPTTYTVLRRLADRPGMMTVPAISSFFASMCGVGIGIFHSSLFL